MNAIPAYEIIPDTADHAAGVEALYDEVFGPGRFAKTAERLREGNTKIADASFVAVDAEGVTGAVRVWPVTIGGKARAWLNDSDVATSTIMCDGRSARAHTTPPSAPTSPDCTPCVICGRSAARLR